MKLDKLNEWLTLIANVGVLLGIAFLVVELDQSNRIAEREARTEVVTSGMELQQIFLESIDLPELMIKISEVTCHVSKYLQICSANFILLS